MATAKIGSLESQEGLKHVFDFIAVERLDQVSSRISRRVETSLEPTHTPYQLYHSLESQEELKRIRRRRTKDKCKWEGPESLEVLKL